ncbi:MAG: hypothetical protein IKZ82_11345 [Clostridia bacterium]|nr:hypothetical protein [Clostridia bacterium]
MQLVLKRIAYSLICVLPFAMLYVLSELFFKDAYLFKWMRDHYYLFLFAAAMLIAFVNFKAGAAFSLSYFVSVTAAQFIGAAVQNHRFATLTADMSEGELSRIVSVNPTFAIWLITFAMLLFACALFVIFKRSNAYKRA